MTWVIRARCDDEIDNCVALLADVHASDRYPLYWPADPRGWLTPPGLIGAWVAAHDHIVGHIALCGADGDASAPTWSVACGLPAERLALVSRLFVAPRARRRALGAALLDVAVAAASSHGRRAALEVLDHDRAALGLYERAGWQRVGSAAAPWAQERGTRAVVYYYLAPG